MMRRTLLILSTMILVGSCIGCKRVQKETDQPPTVDEFSNSWSRVFYADISDMSQIVNSLTQLQSDQDSDAEVLGDNL